MSSYLQSGDLGKLGTEWEVQNERRNQLSRRFGGGSLGNKMDFQSALVMMGVDDEAVLNKLEFNVLGTDKRYDGELLDWQRSAWSSNSVDDRLFQGSDMKLFTNVDLENGTWQVLDEQAFTETLGMDWSGGKPYDVLELQNNRIDFYDFVFAGTSDGSQKEITFDLNSLSNARWGINNYNIREVNTNLLGKGRSTDYESSLAQDTARIILENAQSWITPSIEQALSKYEYGSDEYYKALLEIAVDVMDNEGYLKGNDISSPADEENSTSATIKGSNSFGVTRNENGQIRFSLNNVNNYNIGGVGKVSGSATVSLGRTDKNTNESVVQVGQTNKDDSLKLNINPENTNMEIYGDNVDAKIKASRDDKTYNIRWAASNGSLDTTESHGSVLLETTEKASDNTFNLGKADTRLSMKGINVQVDNMIVDNGSNNTFISHKNSGNYFQTNGSSTGATMMGGNKNNLFDIEGKNGVAVGGNASDMFVTEEGSKNNWLLGMNGADSFRDNGLNNLLSGGEGKDEAELNGRGALVNLGDGEDYKVDINKRASNNAVFTGNRYVLENGDELSISDITVLNYEDFLEAYLQYSNISYADFLMKAELSETATASEIVNALKGIVS
ncbi:hypothetical protein IJG14_00260 [bacterium]|nr:hypothetical protein [bacterium]